MTRTESEPSQSQPIGNSREPTPDPNSLRSHNSKTLQGRGASERPVTQSIALRVRRDRAHELRSHRPVHAGCGAPRHSPSRSRHPVWPLALARLINSCACRLTLSSSEPRAAGRMRRAAVSQAVRRHPSLSPSCDDRARQRRRSKDDVRSARSFPDRDHRRHLCPRDTSR